jgi:vacuolar-type H+-ATPase subunit C/Vma6
MELLFSPADRGYPGEYLLARIKGRRARLIRDWKRLAFDSGLFDASSSSISDGLFKTKSAVSIGAELVREYRWVYEQMNRRLRRTFAPFFLYTELRTVFMCLRRLKDRKAGALDELLASSLLSDIVKDILLDSEDLKDVVVRIEMLFSSQSPRYVGLAETLDSEGLRGVEQQLTDRYLAETVKSGLHPLVKEFFMWLIDSRNAISIYKYLRLDIDKLPSFISGGTISDARFQEVAGTEDMLKAGELIQELTGITVERPDPTSVEIALYRNITRRLRKAGRDPLGVGPILDYLWRCSIETMNLRVLYYGRDLEREAIAAEIVQP